MTKKLIVVDVMAMAFRSFYALQRANLTSPDGQPTGVMYGCLQSLWRLIDLEKPDFFVLASDHQAPTFRSEIYSEYKANRGEMEPELATQLPGMFEMFQAWGIPCIIAPGFEADDIIGTMAKTWSKDDIEVVIFSGDKDFQQLLSPNISLLKQDRKGEFVRVTEQSFHEKYGLQPAQFVDVLSLWGDTSDNIPGAKGVGEKTAIKYIQKYGDIDNLYAHLDDLKGKALQNLREGTESVQLSRTLVTIKTDMSLPIHIEECACDPEQLLIHPGIQAWAQRFGFNSLHRKMRELEHNLQQDHAPSQPTAAASTSPEEQLKSNYDFHAHTIRTQAQLDALVTQLCQAQAFSFDSETTGLDVITDLPIGLSFSCDTHQASYLPLEIKHFEDVSTEQLHQAVQQIFTHPSPLKIAHNLKYDLHMLVNWGIQPVGPFYDTMLAAHCSTHYEGRFGLDPVTEQCLGWQKIPTTALMGKDKQRSMRDVPLAEISLYACEDAIATYLIYEFFQQDLDADSQKLLHTLEAPLAEILMRMERHGISIDFEALDETSDVLATDIARLTTRIHEAAGEEFNIASPKQMGPILYDKLKVHEKQGVHKIKKTKSGWSTDKGTLEAMAKEPIVADILEFRQLSKLKNTYVDPLPQMIHPKTERIHTHYHQTGTATGRLSSSAPNLQNIPIRSERGQQVRKAFRAAPGYKLISADYSQIELRLLAHIAGDAGLCEAFANQVDIHSATAAKMFQLPLDEVTREHRARAKAINYGLAYGMGANKLAATTGVSVAEAKAFIESYFTAFPGIAEYMETSVAEAEQHGYATTILGRRRNIPGIGEKSRGGAMAKNMAINTPIQGSSADLMKEAMINIDKRLQSSKLKAKMLLQVHDELVFEAAEGDVTSVAKVIQEEMENALSDILKIPLEVDIGVGDNWLEAH
ncbi:MAG: DNA polymerase I [Zetaproteobacteria bacterium]|nr:DNA polymerase I [Zetaproteobacteria bacterium]